MPRRLASPRRSPLRRALVGLGAVATLLGPAVTPGAAALPAPPAAVATDGAEPAGGAGCETPLFDAPVRAATAARRTPRAFARAAAADTGPRAGDLADLAADRSVWLDTCGTPYVVDAAPPDDAVRQHAPGAAVAPLSQTFALESLPGSAHTVYLDFTGGTVSGTAWNPTYGDPIQVTPFSIQAPADTAFSDAELVAVQEAWAVVAADYAAFDVNVTTRWPGQAAITRSGSSDPTWGSHVRITNGGPISDRCRCGGVAYINVIANAGAHAYYQPAWVFADGTGTSGKGIGEAAAHEVGHQLGLDHDGTDGTAGTPRLDYSTGSAPWAPIMGAGYYQPLTTWSAGEYPGASNREDDVARITARLGTRADDHADDTTGATPLAPGSTAQGRITTRTDTDAFALTAAGPTTVALRVPAYSDLDASLRVLDSSGTRLALVDPPATRRSESRADGLDATWTGTLPPAGEDLVVVVDGVSQGTPGTAGASSDYASLGAYTLALTTEQPEPPRPLALTPRPADPAVRGRAYAAQPFVATGGTAPYRWSAEALPEGLGLVASSGEVRGTPAAAGTATVRLEVTDAEGRASSGSVDLVVVHPATAADDVVVEGVVGRSLVTRLVASGGDGASYRWDVAASSALPDGLVLAGDGTLSGTPRTAGTRLSTVEVASGGSLTSAMVELRVLDPALVITTRTRGLPVARVDRSYRGVVRTRGAAGEVSWRRVSGRLPRGLRWRPGPVGNVVVEGRARGVEQRVLVLRARDEAGRTAQRRFVVSARR